MPDDNNRREADVRLARLEEKARTAEMHYEQLRKGQAQQFDMLRAMQAQLTRIEANATQRCGEHNDHESRIREHTIALAEMRGMRKTAGTIAGLVSTLIGLLFGAIGLWLKSHGAGP
jgi:hypothetical protein